MQDDKENLMNMMGESEGKHQFIVSQMEDSNNKKTLVSMLKRGQELHYVILFSSCSTLTLGKETTFFAITILTKLHKTLTFAYIFLYF